jgi:hypothetical protein
LGAVPTGLGTPNVFVTVEVDGKPFLRIDLYADPNHSETSEQVLIWREFVTIGFGHNLHLVHVESRTTTSLDLDSYFGRVYASDECLIVASAERLFRVESDSTVKWTTQRLGIDGVIVDGVVNGIIEGQGEWDPPGGWKRFRVDLDSGSLVYGDI